MALIQKASRSKQDMVHFKHDKGDIDKNFNQAFCFCCHFLQKYNLISFKNVVRGIEWSLKSDASQQIFGES